MVYVLPPLATVDADSVVTALKTSFSAIRYTSIVVDRILICLDLSERSMYGLTTKETKSENAARDFFKQISARL